MKSGFELEPVSKRTVAVTDPALGSCAGAVALNNFIVAIDPNDATNNRASVSKKT